MKPSGKVQATHRKLLQLVYAKFNSSGTWPSARSVRLEIRHDGDLADLCRQLGSRLIVCNLGESAGGTCELRIHSLLYLRGAGRDKQLIFKAIQYLLKRYIAEIESSDRIEVSTTEFQTQLRFKEEEARRITKWLHYAPMLTSSFAPDTANKRATLWLSDDILRLEGVRNCDEYLARSDAIEAELRHRATGQSAKTAALFRGQRPHTPSIEQPNNKARRSAPTSKVVGRGRATKQHLPKELRTTFNRYDVLDQIGQGGAGVVVKVRDDVGDLFAAKILRPELATTDRRKRFRNELAFCNRNEHKNVVRVTDFGTVMVGTADTPFFVMPLYDGTLRDLLKELPRPDRALSWFSQILDGVEAAHLRNITHRDLKPENILYEKTTDRLVVADFGIAEFTQEELYTAVETKPDTRLANFLYAAPEQRSRGNPVDQRADIYALGLMLNESFTGAVPQGTGFVTIAARAAEYGYLDSVVDRMMRHDPAGRFQAIDDVKKELIAQKQIFVSRQKIDMLTKQVVPETDVDDPLVREPPAMSAIDYEPGNLIITLTRTPPHDWIRVFHDITGVSFFPGREPRTVRFEGNRAWLRADEHDAAMQRRHFEEWLARAILSYHHVKVGEQKERIANERAALAEKLAREEERQRVLKILRP